MSGAEIDVRDLGRLEGKLDMVIALLSKQDDRHEDHDRRIRVLENGRSKLIGIAAGAGAAVSAATTAVGMYFKNGG